MITLVPAYGRDYNSRAVALADFNDGKDFVVRDFSNPWDGMKANQEDLVREDVVKVKMRYRNLTQVFILNVKTGRMVK